MNTPWNPAVLVIGRDRLFYSGLAGNSKKPRKLGNFKLYFATDTPFEIDAGQGWQDAQAALVRPYQTHRLLAPSGHIHEIGLEPESLSDTAQAQLTALFATPQGCATLAKRVRERHRRLPHLLPQNGLSTAAFDRLFLGQELAPRPMDERIRQVLQLMCDEVEDSTVAAEDYASEIGLSPSRFLYLFKLNTGVPFRSMRMWKRARRFLDHANSQRSLTDVALELGYPDSSHFSHSIRRTFGLKPRSIRQGSKHLKVYPGANYTLAPQIWAG
ncbi:helix-turn-helix domain-containing protein [Thalassobius sp. S69A]|uniref:helix-turn-helix domain-containing protein n=1 Tax=unclassified Thalassovita TaxID=2619711 RepID=UPI003C7E4D06